MGHNTNERQQVSKKYYFELFNFENLKRACLLPGLFYYSIHVEGSLPAKCQIVFNSYFLKVGTMFAILKDSARNTFKW